MDELKRLSEKGSTDAHSGLEEIFLSLTKDEGSDMVPSGLLE